MMERLKVDMVIVLHVKKGFENRGVFMEKQLQDANIPFDYMLDGDIADISDSRLNLYFKGDMAKKNAVTSCALKHLLACEKVVNEKKEFALFLEDDILLLNNFKEVFNKTIDEINANPSFQQLPLFVSYENTTHKNVESPQKNKFLYKSMITRAAGAYLLNSHAAKAIVENARKEKVAQPIDWYYNTLAEQQKLSIYWCYPTIAEQGSFNGMFSSSLSARKQGLFRKFRFELQKFFKDR